MDNVTHSLIGLAAGEAWATARRKNPAPIWIASLLANNVPDIDVPLLSLLTKDPLAKLLHHRGYSHTLVMGPLQGLLVFLVVWACYRKKEGFSARDVLAVSLLGPFLHIFADSWNSYGVHPFWPFSNEWYYGDFVFILEPWIWMIFLPVLFFATNSRALRAIFALFGGGILVTAWLNSLVPLLVAGMLSVFVVGFLLLLRLIPRPGHRIATAVSAMGIFLFAFALTSNSLKAQYARPGYELALSPYPGNPFCWQAHSAGFRGENYEASVLRVAPWPGLFPVGKCPVFFEPGTNAPLALQLREPSDASILLGTFTAPKSQLQELARDCRAEEFLRFARIPFWKQVGEGWMMGDLRFDRGGGRSFATVSIPGAHCPEAPTPWQGKFLPFP